MAAIAAIYLSHLEKGDTVLLPMEAYGTTLQLARSLSKFGVRVETAWPSAEKLAEAVKPSTKLVLVETITNPLLRVIDVPSLAKCCEEAGVTLVVDNTFATPVLYKPLKDGAKIVLHSATKYLSGHNDLIAGTLSSDEETIRQLWDWRRRLGTIMAPMEAYLLLRGLKTLELRVKRHCENAQAVAEFLQDHPKVKQVHYPGLPDDEHHKTATRILKGGYGGVVSFRVKGGKTEVERLLNSLKTIKPAPSLGGPESLLTYPVISASSTLSKEERDRLGITEDLLRLSVGLEDLQDILEDLDQALNKIS